MQQLNKAQNFRLATGIVNLGTGSVKIVVHEGTAWLTNGTHDIHIKAGQQLELSSAEHAMVISSLDKESQVVFDVEHITATNKRQRYNNPTRLVAAAMSIIKG